MRALLRQAAPLLLAMLLALPLLASPPSTADYLGWLETRRQLWVHEMKRMESHEHGQYKVEYRALSDRINLVRQQAEELKSAQGEQEEKLRQELILNVSQVESALEFLLSETPELAEEEPPTSDAPPRR
jgi:hypothetical protein